MIRMEEPSFCFNAYDIGPPRPSMWRRVDGRPGTTAHELVRQIFVANTTALQVYRSPLRNIILNVHGFAGGLRIGGIRYTATEVGDLGAFGILKPLNVGTIWLIACSAAYDTTGKAFCTTLARTAGTVVIASDESQRVTAWQALRLGVTDRLVGSNIDDFEGKVFAFYPDGGIRAGTNPTEFVHTVRI